MCYHKPLKRGQKNISKAMDIIIFLNLIIKYCINLVCIYF